MSNISREEEAQRKQAIFDAMSPRRQRHILNRIGYDRWDPFQEPKDPIDIRTDRTKRTTQMLVREFLQASEMKTYSTSYGQGVFDICHGIINSDDRYRGMFEFSIWYRDLLIREGHIPGEVDE